MRVGATEPGNLGRCPASTIAEAQQAGDVSKTLEATTLARFVLSAWEGALIAARADRSPRAFEVFFTVVFGQILR
ncbi:TetR family transcriptional regulator C-terminal domain-containing protein [Streptomyces sp. NBC_00873]|uniref:TetR family transcriptional regulator C-terminal domain-containing protein n=1 Tax=unclassified Streptomyces TaxID=2593676 RepID=UPI00386F319D|nr:TetR family transcriptional regulator C-terminal domain-containing protein [Streptomyces sp. NBC_00873]WTA48151.1 TetR family transcriptional regulator C-terminal domain-containing protein [Streptomyces sp. NBC_00842]